MQNNNLSKVIDEILSYYMTYKPLEQEVGDYLRSKYASPSLYANDLRHQYASAVMAQKYGSDKATTLGNLNEFFDFSGSGREDTQIDQFNNKVGREYATKYPNYNKQQFLDALYKEHQLNKDRRLKELGF